MPTDWDTYTNAALLAVNPATLSSDDLQTFREEMLNRELSTIPPPARPATPPPPGSSINLQSPDGVGFSLGVQDDGSLLTVEIDDVTKQHLHVAIPDGIGDGQILVFDAATGRMQAGYLPTTKVVPGDALTDDTSTDLPLNAEDGTSWVQADTLPDWLVSDSTGETLTNEAGALALTGG